MKTEVEATDMISRFAELLSAAGTKKNDAKGQFDNVDVGLERAGKKIILPADPTEMSITDGITTLQRLQKQENEEVRVHEPTNALPFEGAYALTVALERLYGWVNAQPTPGFFGPTPPNMVSVEIAPNKFRSVIWGRMQIPGIDGYLEPSADMKDGMPQFKISGVVRKKFMKQVGIIAELTRKIISEESIYRGKPLRLDADEYGQIDFQSGAVKFLDVSKVSEDDLVFPKDTMEQIRVNLFTPLEHPELCREHKIPLSRKILFEGPYGVGKTVTAYVSAKKATEKGWTFIYLNRVTGIQNALLFARKYAPAVIFAEDIDRIIDGEDRDVATDDVLNTIDGVDTKGFEIVTILTTNNVEKIHPAMLRPGRLDSVISVRAPDAEAAEKLIRVYARGLLAEGATLKKAGKALSGQIPATIREAVERSKLYAISRGGDIKIVEDDIVLSAEGMKAHLALLNRDRKAPSPAENFYESFKVVVGDGLNGTKQKIDELHAYHDLN